MNAWYCSIASAAFCKKTQSESPSRTDGKAARSARSAGRRGALFIDVDRAVRAGAMGAEAHPVMIKTPIDAAKQSFMAAYLSS